MPTRPCRKKLVHKIPKFNITIVKSLAVTILKV